VESHYVVQLSFPGADMGDRASVCGGVNLWTSLPRTAFMPLFTVDAAGAAATLDPAIMRFFLRRMGLLDSTSVLDNDTDLQRRIESLFKSLLSRPRAPLGPSTPGDAHPRWCDLTLCRCLSHPKPECSELSGGTRS
jgi:hypothetical protein